VIAGAVVLSMAVAGRGFCAEKKETPEKKGSP
jgi:hypothetical protein